MIHSIHATSATPVVLATQFKRDQRVVVVEILEAHVALGDARHQGENLSQ